MSVHAVGSGAHWDHRRNTSEVRPGTVTAREAVAALRAWARQNPAHADWIAAGYPTLTDAEHVARFGAAYYDGKRRRK